MTPGPSPADPSAVVLLEGASDVAAVGVLARRRGIDTGGSVRLVDLHGVTNVRRILVDLAEDAPWLEVLGLCDAAEVGFVLGALEAVHGQVQGVEALPAHGFFVCRDDLEEELIRGLGDERTVEVVDELGLGAKLAALRQQPAWRDRPLADQLHRFCGVASGRKAVMAGAMAAALAPDECPAPLGQLLARMTRTSSSTSP